VETVYDGDHAYGDRVGGAWGYQTHRMDEVADLDPPLDPDRVFPYLHLGARYYDPATGRFLQRDPIGTAGGLNVYSYVESNPMSHLDPSGLDVQPTDTTAESDSKPKVEPQGPLDGPLGVYHKVEATLILAGPGMIGAAIGDTMLMITGTTWWYDGEGGRGQMFYCIRRVAREIAHEWE
jgi:RHS repeat-associated protein